MNKKIDLCLVDCSSIQHYVFGSNKLKTNIGASHLVAKIYEVWMKEVLLELFKDADKIRFDDWKKKPAEIKMSDPAADYIMETGYIGGGNALLLFRDIGVTDAAGQFVRAWTRELLLRAPGIQPVVAILQDKTVDELSEAIPVAFKLLNKNKNAFVAETTLPRHGITADCKFTDGYSIETTYYPPKSEAKYVSSVAHAKLSHMGEAVTEMQRDYADVIGEERTFAMDTNELGQIPNDENHIAIVHIDGNGMGKRFEDECKTLPEKRLLSLRVERANRTAMKAAIKALLFKDDEQGLTLLDRLIGEGLLTSVADEEKHLQILPLRPLILNGDDTTFICNARLGFFLTETFMRAFAAEKLNKDANEKDNGLRLQNPEISSCAGIAIIKTSYPFYRGYELAEALCANAKKEYHAHKGETSWLDFHISFRGLSDALKELRAKNYRVAGNELWWRPWRITTEKESNAFAEVKRAINHFRNGAAKMSERWPNSKLKQLEHALVQGPQATKDFIAFARARNLRLPLISELGAVQDSGWDSNKTPYFDILEIMEFYPELLINQGDSDAILA